MGPSKNVVLFDRDKAKPVSTSLVQIQHVNYITVALRERLEREKSERSTEARVERLMAIGRRCASMLGDGPSAVEHGDFLYDERGLPK